MKAQLFHTAAWGIMAIAMISRITYGDAVAAFIMLGAAFLFFMSVRTAIKERKEAEAE